MLSNAQIQEHAHRILQQDEFTTTDSGSQQPNLLQWLMQTLQQWLSGLHIPLIKGNATMYNVLAKAFVYGLIAVLIAVPLGIAVFWIVKLFRKPKSPVQTGVTVAERRAANLSFTKLSEEALQKSNYRQAMHYLFLAAISWVIQDQFFHNAAFLTSREIAQAIDFSKVTSHMQLKSLFESMLNLDEPRWFGNIPTSSQDFEAFNGIFKQFQVQVKPNAY